MPLHNILKDCSQQIKEVIKLLKNEGVPIPPTTEEKPKANPIEIPTGVKLNNEEIANMLIVKLVSATMICTKGLTESVRTDVGSIWLKFLLKRAEFDFYFKPLMQKRGWLKTPPDYNPPGRPQ